MESVGLKKEETAYRTKWRNVFKNYFNVPRRRETDEKKIGSDLW